MTGEIPPPCAGFTLTKISETKALFHGGFNPETGLCIPDVYVAELSGDTVVSAVRFLFCPYFLFFSTGTN